MLISGRDNVAVLASECLYVSCCCCCCFVLQITPMESYLRECVGLLLTTASHLWRISYDAVGIRTLLDTVHLPCILCIQMWRDTSATTDTRFFLRLQGMKQKWNCTTDTSTAGRSQSQIWITTAFTFVRMQRRRFYEAENCFAKVFPLSAFFPPSKNVIVYSQLVLPP